MEQPVLFCAARSSRICVEVENSANDWELKWIETGGLESGSLKSPGGFQFPLELRSRNEEQLNEPHKAFFTAVIFLAISRPIPEVECLIVTLYQLLDNLASMKLVVARCGPGFAMDCLTFALQFEKPRKDLYQTRANISRLLGPLQQRCVTSNHSGPVVMEGYIQYPSRTPTKRNHRLLHQVISEAKSALPNPDCRCGRYNMLVRCHSGACEHHDGRRGQLTVRSAEKKGPYTLCLLIAQNTFTFGYLASMRLVIARWYLARWGRGFAIDYLPFTLLLGKTSEKTQAEIEPAPERNFRPAGKRLNRLSHAGGYSTIKKFFYRLAPLRAFAKTTTTNIDKSLPSKETLRGHSDSSFRGEGYIQCCVGVRLCDMYSNQELAEIHFMYGKADGNAALARRLYQERYPQRQCPDYLWGHLKSLVYSSPVPDLESLRNRIVACSKDIHNTPGVWDRVRRSMRHRCEVCIQAGGGHFEHLL
ncbi:hypothetical protein ANN_10800 [Periplaneta americana]|uniref:DUF4817 domain-containing protein n=1 Tax=Periplaneta americana TaxID=6978 RepID=A0ABQ8T390_PERAM|nr:hypothetical protein ANN_10800 [Periplaneta americana]